MHVFTLVLGFLCLVNSAPYVEHWISTGDKAKLMEPQPKLIPSTGSDVPHVQIFPAQRFQTIDGFGWTLTGGSAQVLKQRLSDIVRAKVLQELFNSTERNIGTSVLRLSIGASDLDAAVFSYHDLPKGSTPSSDPTLSQFKFSASDVNYLIPLLKDIVKINPSIKILAVPWSAPLWMKSSWNFYGQNLKTDCLALYAKYFVKYIEGMQAQGIPIYAITPQNEPLNSHNMPSQIMEASQQLVFIRDHLGPALKTAGLTTKIIIYDHNLDRIDYPTTILSDPVAAQYIIGSAFHQYAGEITALDTMQARFPTKGVYLTEYWVSAPEDATNDKFNDHLTGRFKMTILNGMNHHCKMALQWNLATDETYGPHTTGGCSACLGALTISSSGAITRNSGLYTVGHASKFVVPGSVRIGHVETKSGVDVSAFVKPDGDYVILVSNIAGTQTVRFGFDNQRVNVVLPKESISTLVWHRT